MALRYWVGGTGTWDGSNTTNWSATSGGAGGASVPGSADQVIFDASSGTGTVTLGISPTIQQLDFSGFAQTFNFQTNTITISSTASPAFTGSTSMTVTGTPVINIVTSSIKNVIAGAVTESNSISFNVSGSSTFSISGSVRNLDFTGFSGQLSSGSRTIFGNLLLSATMTTGTTGNNTTTFAATSGTQTINTNGVTFNDNMTFSGVGGARQLLSALTANRIQHTAGNLDLNTYTFSVLTYSVSGSSASGTIFTGGGRIVVRSNDEQILVNTSTNYTATGNLDIFCSYAGATGTRQIGWISNEAQAADFTASTVPGVTFNTAATDTILFNGGFRNVDTTGRTSPIRLSNLTLYGNLTIPAGASMSAVGGTATFAATSGVKTITTNGVTLTATTFQFSGVGGAWQLQGAVTLGSTTNYVAGTLDLNGFTYTTTAFTSSSPSVRVIAFGTGNITLVGSGTVWNMTTTTNFSRTGTPTVNVSNNSATATTVQTGSLSEAQALDFNYTVGTYTLTDTSAVYRNLSFVGFSGTVPNSGRIMYGGFNAGSTATFSAGSNTQNFFAASGTWNITSNGRTFDFPFTFSGTAGTWVLQGALTLTATRTTTLANGTLNLNGFTLTTGLFNSSGSSVRAIVFGTGNITLTGTGTVWNTLTTTNFSRTGTPTVNVSNNSATATTITTGALTEAQALDFNYTVGTYALTDTSAVYRNLNLTGFAGTFPNSARTYFGGFNAGSTATMTAGTNVQTFSATSGTWNITRNGRTLDFPFTFNGIGGTWRLQDDFTVGSSRAFTLTNGTLDINSQTTSVGIFTLPASTSRAIANGTLNCASVTHTAGAFAVGSGYNISTTGAYTFTAGSITINDGVTLPLGTFSSSNGNVRTIAFGTGQISLSGNAATVWTTSTAANWSHTGTFKVVLTYAGSTGTRVVSYGLGSTPVNFSATGSSGFIFDTVSTDAKSFNGPAQNVDLTNMQGVITPIANIFGNLTVTSGNTLGSSASAMTFAGTSGTQLITSAGKTFDFPVTFNGVGGTFQLQDALTVGSTRTTTLTAGTLALNGYTLTTGIFNMGSGAVRSLAFGAGNITVNGTGSVFVWPSIGNITVSGSRVINVANNSATATTVTTNTPTEAQALDFNYTVGTYALTDTSAVYRSVNLTGFAGTFPNNTRTYFGGFNAGSTATMPAGANAQTFAATSGTWNIASNGRTLDFPLTFNGVGGTWRLADALTMGGTRTFTLTAGTFDANNYSVVTGPVSSSNSNVRTLALGSGTWVSAGAGASAWNFATSTNATITGTGTISMQGATAKTFAGGGLTWPTLNQGGPGALTISGNNTFANITNTWTSSVTITFTAGSTQSVNDFTASGTPTGQLTLNSTSTSPYNLVKLGGGDVNVSYCTISYSNASP